MCTKVANVKDWELRGSAVSRDTTTLRFQMSYTAKTKMRNDTETHINTHRGCHNHPFLHFPPFPTSGCFTHCKVPLPRGNKYSHYPFMSAGWQRHTHTPPIIPTSGWFGQSQIQSHSIPRRKLLQSLSFFVRGMGGCRTTPSNYSTISLPILPRVCLGYSAERRGNNNPLSLTSAGIF